jgi:hypothetical protein
VRRILLALFLTATGGCGSSDTKGDGATNADLSTVGGQKDMAGDLAMSMVNPNPTISSWMGTNVSSDLSRVDITYQMSPFDTPTAQKDANGYPAMGMSGKSSTDLGFILTSGSYNISFKGNGTLAVSGIGKLTGTWQSANGEQRNVVQITGTPGAFGNFLTLTVTNGPGQSVTDIHILYPGFDYDTKTVFLPQLIAILAPFRAMRFMDWEATNGSQLANWSDRPAAAHYGRSDNGEPYEHIIELVNETGKDMWVTVPEHVSDDFIHQFAKLLATTLDFQRIQTARDQAGFTTPFQVIVENSNETWNQGFTAYATFLAAAKANPTRFDGKYTGTVPPTWMSQNADLMRVGQYEADRLVNIAGIFQTEFGAVGKKDIVSPVLSGWAIGAAYSDVGLQFIKTNYGDPKKYIRYVAIAPYISPDDAQTGSLSALFTNLEQAIAAKDGVYQDFETMASSYGLTMVAYEGGQSITGTTNQPLKHLAQHDARMYQAYLDDFALWHKHFGEGLFMHFSLAGEPGLPENIYQYGYWGSIIGVLEDPTKCEPNLPMLSGNESIASVVHHCPKYRALAEQVGH